MIWEIILNDSPQDELQEVESVPGTFDEHRQEYNWQHLMADSIAVSTIDSPPEWDGLSPDVVLKCYKTVPPEVLRASGVHDFYKSYPSWVKMSQDLKNKSLAWFRSLPEETQGFLICFFLFGN